MFKCDLCKKHTEVVATIKKPNKEKQNFCYDCFKKEVKVKDGENAETANKKE